MITVSPLNQTLKSWEERKWSLFNTFLDCWTYSSCQYCVIRIHECHIFVLRKIHFKQMKIIAVYTQLKQLRNKAWKKFRPERESNPWPLRYRCSALTNWAIKPTGSWSIVSSLYTRRWTRNWRKGKERGPRPGLKYGPLNPQSPVH